ncbi:hypothetical protein SESBI_32395 [Sesbania bispinosa]|nr:hypothetical protein SESBI_32395 [Sesbania bispinosa]
MEGAATRSNGRRTATQTLPPKRGLVKIRVVKSIVKSVTGFASLAASGAGSGRKNVNGNGEDDRTSLSLSSPSATPPIPSGYNSDA